MADDIKKIIEKSQNPKLIEDVFEFAKKAYIGKTRVSGENYIDHALRVAKILSDMNVDDATVAFGLLHDVIDDLPESAQKSALQEVKKKFGSEMAELIQKINGLWVVRYSLKTGGTEKFLLSKNKTENLRKMFLAIASDPRVILVELISRLDGLNFLHVFSEDQKKFTLLKHYRYLLQSQVAWG